MVVNEALGRWQHQLNFLKTPSLRAQTYNTHITNIQHLDLFLYLKLGLMTMYMFYKDVTEKSQYTRHIHAEKQICTYFMKMLIMVKAIQAFFTLSTLFISVRKKSKISLNGINSYIKVIRNKYIVINGSLDSSVS